MYNTSMFEHDSLDIALRSPQGAVLAGEKITIGGRLVQEEGTQVFLVLVYPGNREEQLPMTTEKGLCSVSFTAPEGPGLLFYSFLLKNGENIRWYGGRTGKGSFSPERRQSWQITVYDRDFSTPDWFRNSVCYQIFPDRFCRSSQSPWKEGAAYHRSMGRTVRLHKNWQEEPEYQPASGEKDYSPNDYFGGDLRGIEEKLDYLQEMGISCLYLNPIFEADSNHRYNTADYRRIDPMLGTEEDFIRLCVQARQRGIRILLDGVFPIRDPTASILIKKERMGTVPVILLPRPIILGIASAGIRRNMRAGGALLLCQTWRKQNKAMAPLSTERGEYCSIGWRRGLPAGGWMWPMSCRIALSGMCAAASKPKVRTMCFLEKYGKTVPISRALRAAGDM